LAWILKGEFVNGQPFCSNASYLTALVEDPLYHFAWVFSRLGRISMLMVADVAGFREEQGQLLNLILTARDHPSEDGGCP
jgi:hypothetical protein